MGRGAWGEPSALRAKANPSIAAARRCDLTVGSFSTKRIGGEHGNQKRLEMGKWHLALDGTAIPEYPTGAAPASSWISQEANINNQILF